MRENATVDQKSLILVNTAVLLFGTAGLFARELTLPSIAITFGRVFFSSLTLGIVMMIRRIPFRIASRKDLFLLAAAGALLALHWWSFMESIKRGGVAVGTITFSSFPLFVTFLEPVIYREKLQAKNAVMALVILLGVIITIPSFSLENTSFTAILIGMASALCYALLALMNRGLSRRCGGIVTSFYEQLTAAIVLLPMIGQVEASPSARDILLLMILGIFMTALAHTMFIQSLRGIPAGLAGICSSMETVYGILLAYLVLGEAPALREVIGGAVILAAVILAQLKHPDNGKSKPNK